MALVGTLMIVAFLDWRIFAGCLVLLVIITAVYTITSGRTVRFNQEYLWSRLVEITGRLEAPD